MSRSSSAGGFNWTGYNPLLNKMVFGVALLGILLSVHLTIQEQRGFVDGCTGFEGVAAAETFNCAAVLQSDAAALFGVSNVTWGFLFYGLVAVLSVALAYLSRNRRGRFKQARAGVISFGVLYTLYLLYYQFAYVGEFCLLCLISAGLVAGLFVLMIADLRTPRRRSAGKHARRDVRREGVTFAGLVLALLVLAGADYAYFAQQQPAVAAVDDAVVEDCYFSRDHEPIPQYQQLITANDAATGNPGADVLVLEYFDPNCPACRMNHPVMKQVIEQYGDQARFVFKPLALWEHSINQIQALYIAAHQGRFFDLLDAQYEHQQQQGLSDAELASLAEEIGMDGGELMTRLQEDVFRGPVMMQRRQASGIGVNSVPTVMINGRIVHHESRTPRCIGAFIEAAAS